MTSLLTVTVACSVLTFNSFRYIIGNIGKYFLSFVATHTENLFMQSVEMMFIGIVCVIIRVAVWVSFLI